MEPGGGVIWTQSLGFELITSGGDFPVSRHHSFSCTCQSVSNWDWGKIRHPQAGCFCWLTFKEFPRSVFLICVFGSLS